MFRFVLGEPWGVKPLPPAARFAFKFGLLFWPEMSCELGAWLTDVEGVLRMAPSREEAAVASDWNVEFFNYNTKFKTQSLKFMIQINTVVEIFCFCFFSDYLFLF
jgi:hypothetical protein